MRSSVRLYIIASVALMFLCFSIDHHGADVNTTHWYRGNTHTHARFSDNTKYDDVPEIAKWYRKAGYDFLMIAEHNNRLTKKRIICHDDASKLPGFLMLCGLELSENRHLTALGIDRFIDNETSLQDGVNKTLEAGGVPILNHPLEPVVKSSDFLKAKGLNHLEIFNGNNPQDTPGSEMLWDSVMSVAGGRPVYAVASDDNHYAKSKVGRGWIMVDSPSLTKEEIKDNIRKGNFYASTGIFLSSYSVTGKSINITTENGTQITFIGKFGKILKNSAGSAASYLIKGNEHYVRIRISDKEGKMAWTQPFFIK